MKYASIILFFILFSLEAYGDSMNQSTLESIIMKHSKNPEGSGGFISFVYSEISMYVISDVSYDRMRIIAPITEFETLSKKQVDAVMESNFHHALDARYAVSEGILYSAYIHPLSKLDEDQVKSAMEQVANLKISFGDDYSSGLLTYNKNSH